MFKWAASGPLRCAAPPATFLGPNLVSNTASDPQLHAFQSLQAARKINIAKFRAGRAQFMVVTDVAARGIDIPLLDNVINFDFPPQPKLFVHRVGRAARWFPLTLAVEFCSSVQSWSAAWCAHL